MRHERYVIGQRPDAVITGVHKPVPPDWVIYNAPRPLLGVLTWTGKFISGIFYAASPKDDDRAYKVNESLDAVILNYVTIEDVKEFVTKVLIAEYPGYADMDFEENKEYFMDKYLDYMNWEQYQKGA